MDTFLSILATLLLLYVLKDYLIAFLKFVFDVFLGKLIEALINWLQPVNDFFSSSQSVIGARIDIFRLLGSTFLFLLTLGLSLVNYVLILFGMELLVPGEITLGVIGLSGATLASVSVTLLELALGFILLELVGMTDLLGWHSWSRARRWLLGSVAGIFLLIVIAGEAGIALYRLYQVGTESPEEISKVHRIITELPYWITAALAVGVPVVTALSAFSLRDILLILAWLVLTAFLSLCKVLRLALDILHSIVTHIDDLLEKILSAMTWPIENFTSFIVLILVKSKLFGFLAIGFIFILPLYGCGDRTVESPPSPEKRRHIVVLMDNTGSFKAYLTRASANCGKYIDALGLGDGFTLLLIDAQSLDGTNPPYVGTTWLPEVKSHIVPQQVRYRIKAAKDSIKSRVGSIKSLSRADATDLFGAIVRASNLLHQDTSRYVNYLLVFSDMKDTQGSQILQGTDLNGVHVKLLFTNAENEKLRKNLATWQKKLFDLGALSVDMLNPDQSEAVREYTLPF